MKISTLLLAGSLATNAALVAVILTGASGGADDAIRLHPAAPVASAPGANGATNAASDAAAWTALQTGDLATQRDRLKAAGLPPEIIRAILTAQVRESFAARRKALDAGPADTDFWKQPNLDPKIQAALRDLSREQEKILRDLLGRDQDDNPVYTAYLRRQFGNLSDSKIEQLRLIQDNYNSQRSDLYANARNGLLPDEQQKMAALDKAMHAEFAAALTPEELAEYDLRASNTAENLRYNLAAFDPSEQEFRTLFQLQQAFDDKFGRMYGTPTQDEMQARSAGQKQLDADIKAALGDDRYADYQRGRDYSYRQTSQLVARLELPPETANQIYAVQQDLQQRATALRRSSSLPADDLNQQLTALADEGKTKIAGVLGDRGYEAYKQYGGQWLQNLTPRPRPAAKSP